MRCVCCNVNLSDKESTNRHPTTNEFLDMCTKCLNIAGIDPVSSGVTDTQYEDDDSDYEDNYPSDADYDPDFWESDSYDDV